MQWIRKRLRGNQVYVRVGDDLEPIVQKDGRVDVVYKLAPGAKVYRAAQKNLSDANPEEDVAAIEFELSQAPAAPASNGKIPDDAIIVYTDGACTGNPGPMGVGVVILDKSERVEIGEFIGEVGTNNIAELTAIKYALAAISPESRSRTVVIHSDSSYSIGLLSKNWKAKANVELVAEIRALVAEFSDLRFVKVKGHAGIPENERCDELATSAISSR